VMYEVEQDISSIDPAAQIVLHKTVTWGSTDELGNVALHTINYFVRDSTAPTFQKNQLHDHDTIECDVVPDAPELLAVDSCDLSSVGQTTSNDSTVSSTCNNTYILERKYTVTDSSGNTTTYDQYFDVRDRTPPYITGHPASVTAECDNIPAIQQFAVTDACDETISPIVTHDSSSVIETINAHAYTTVHYYSAKDVCGNQSSTQQTVYVSDNKDPTMDTSNIQDTILSIDQVPIAVYNQALCTDECTADADITYGTPAPARRELGVQTPAACYEIVTDYSCTDVDQNTTLNTQTITIRDLSPPVIEGACGVLSDGELTDTDTYQFEYGTQPDFDTSKNAGVFVSDESDTSADFDNVGLVVEKVDVNTTNSHVFSEVWKYTATDYCNNVTVKTCTVVVVDTTGPPLSDVEPRIEAECDQIPEPCDVSFVDGSESSTSVIVPSEITQSVDGNNFEIVRTWTATDENQNDTSKVQTIVVTDTSPPVFSRSPADKTVSCDCYTLAESATITAVDNCEASVTVTPDETTEPLTGSNYKITRTWVVSDSNDNSTTQSQVIVVEDNTPPRLFPVHENMSGVHCTVTFTNDVVAMDNCDNNLADVQYNEAQSDIVCDGSYTLKRTWEVADVNGNSTSHQQIVQYVDSTAPEGLAVPMVCAVAGEATQLTKVVERFELLDECTDVVDLQVSCNGECTYDAVTDTITFASLANTTYTISVDVKDECGNPYSTSREVKIFEGQYDVSSLQCGSEDFSA